MTALTWLGVNARWVLAIGSVVALCLPQLAAWFRPFLPYLVCLVLALSMARIDLVDVAKGALRPAFLARIVALSVLLMPVTGVIYLMIARLANLSEADGHALVYLAAAPPIASAAGLCFILGFNARLAMEVTLGATILTPIIGPAMVAILIPDAVDISSLALARRLAFMIAGGVIIAVLIRTVVGPARINRHKSIFDGVSAAGMLLFIFPLFDGVLATILADPLRALWVLCLGAVFNIGVNMAVQKLLTGRTAADRGALGLLWGNRTIAIYLAALPPDPQFTLFTALYQFPMYFTPLLFGRQRASASRPPT